MKWTKKITYTFAVSSSYLVSYPTLRKLSGFRTIFYTLWLKRFFKSFGKDTRLGTDITLLGGEGISIGHHSVIGSHSILATLSQYENQTFSPFIEIGDQVTLGEYNNLSAISGIRIGNGVLTGRWVTITDNSHGQTDTPDLNTIPSERPLVTKGPVIIEDNVWIGDKATILPGVRIGRGSIIGANAVVVKSVPPHSLVGGNPATVRRIMHPADKEAPR